MIHYANTLVYGEIKQKGDPNIIHCERENTAQQCKRKYKTKDYPDIIHYKDKYRIQHNIV